MNFYHVFTEYISNQRSASEIRRLWNCQVVKQVPHTLYSYKHDVRHCVELIIKQDYPVLCFIVTFCVKQSKEIVKRLVHLRVV